MNKKTLLFVCGLIITTMCLNAQGTWTQIANYGGGAVTEARAFSIGTKGYIVSTPDLWEYNPATSVWTQMASFTGPIRLSGVAFSIGSKGYFGTGGGLNDFYEYDQATNSWTQKANFGGVGREGAVGIAVNGKGYAGTGGNYLDDWWEFDPLSNSWTQKANLSGPGRYHAGAFSIGNFGYVCTGFDGAFFNDLWQYDPTLNIWVQKANLPSTTRDRPVGLGAIGKGYIVCGWSGGTALNDAWEYDPLTNGWTAIVNFGGAGRYNHCGFVIAGSLYVGTGYAQGVVDDVWMYGNACGVQASSVSTLCNGSCDGSAMVTFPDSNAVTSYSWNTIPAQTTATATGLCSGNYIVTVTDTAGCTSSLAVQVTSPAAIAPIVICTPDTCFGQANGTACVPSGYSCYLWGNGATTPCITGLAAGVYSVTVCDASGCTGSATGLVTQPPAMMLSLSQFDATCQTCANGNATANITGGQNPYSFVWSNGGVGAFIQNLLPGWYTCCVTDVNGCTVCDSVFVSFPISINELNTGSIIVSPNPFSDFIFVDFENRLLHAPEIKVIDVLAKAVNVKLINEKQKIKINTGKLNAGIYFIEINVNSEIYRYKLLKR